MKKIIKYLLVLVIGILIGYYAAPKVMGARQSTYNPYNTDSTLSGSSTTNSATTTMAGNASEVMSENTDRQYALVINDSDTVLYLHLANYTGMASATAGTAINQGIRLNASGGSYEIDSNNLYTGDIWVASSTAGKVVTFVEI